MGWSERFKYPGSRDLVLNKTSSSGEDMEEIHPELRVPVLVVQSAQCLFLGNLQTLQNAQVPYA